MRSLRVLFLASRDWYHPGTTGGDNTLWENARYLAASGHRVTYVAADFPGAERRVTIDGIDVVRLGGLYTLWLRTFLYYIRHGRGRFDIVVTEGFGGSRIPRLAPLYVRVPIVTAWHQIHRDLFAAQYSKALVGLLSMLELATARIHRDTLVQAYTPEWKAAFPKIGFKLENIFVVPVSIREDWLTQSDRHFLPEPTILWIGKMRRYKCPDHAIRAMPDVVRQLPNSRLIIAARRDDTGYESELRRLVRELGLERSVEFRFDVTEVDKTAAEGKRQLFRSSRIMVLPSSVEGFGIVVLEANSCGVPVVASSGVPESAVRDGYNGLRYRFGDITELSARIVQILKHDDLYENLSKNSRVFAQQFGWRTVSSQYAEVIERAASRDAGDSSSSALDDAITQ